MFYLNKQKKFKPIPPSQIHNILIIPCKQRQAKDHQIVYRFFINHPYLDQIERTKSVNARMKCVANIQILQKKQFKQQRYVLLCDIQNQIAVLSLKKVKQFLTFDERPIRQNMQRLAKFKLFSLMKYNQLLFLAQMYTEQQFKYSQFLYKQGDIISNFYLIQKGQFHYIKQYEELESSIQKYKIDLQRVKNKNKNISKNDLPFFSQQSVNKKRSKSKKIKQYRVGFTQGDNGQSIGEEEIIMQKNKRQYGAKCFSTNNCVLVFNKTVLQMILSQNDEIRQKLKKQTLGKCNSKRQLINHIKKTKANLTNIIKHIQKQKQQIRENNLLLLQNELNNTKLPSLRHKQITSELPDINRKFSSVSRVKEKNIFVTQDLHKHKHSGKDSSQYFKTQQQDENQTFALTEFKKVKVKNNDIINENLSIQRQTLIQDVSFNDSIQIKASKSWNVNLANLQNKKRLNFKQKYIGMIDSSTLVKQKQYIVSIKKDKQINDSGRQFQIKQKNLWRLMQKQKQKAKIKSPAHSKQFMEKMLLSALRKAGYNEASPLIQTQMSGNITQRELSQQLQRQIQIKEQLKKGSKKLKFLKKQELNSEVLQINPFDQCYFGKLN